MAQTIQTLGIVLHSMPVGDFDKRLVLLTKEKGKITVFAKGARRPNSQLLAGSQIFALGEYLVYMGRNTNSISQINLKETFYELRQDIEKLSYGLYFNELIQYFTEENMEVEDYIILLYRTLASLSKKTMTNDLIKSIFELKTLSFSGLTPEVTQCLYRGCQKTESQLSYLSSLEGGMFCQEHGKLVKDSIFITEGTRYTMQYILSSSLQHLYSFKVTDKILNELKLSLRKYFQVHIDYQFKSLDFINNFNKVY
jgi:DNA repair protein RecO (recombination protein O)